MIESARSMLKAKDNPFRVDRLAQIPFEPQGVTWPALMARLESLECRAALVGPEGSGKTTLLDELAVRLMTDGFTIRHLRLCADEPNPSGQELIDFASAARTGDVILFDGADHLSPRRWRRFRQVARHAGGLIVTAHRPGLLPTLIELITSPALLRRIAAELVGTDIGWTGEQWRVLHETHDGNIRDALRSLYDRWADDGGCG